MSESVIEQYSDNLEAEGYADSTIQLYTSNIRQAFKHDAFTSVSKFNSFINFRRKNLSDNSYNSQLDALSNFSKITEFIDYSLDEMIAAKIKRTTKTSRVSQPELVQERRAYSEDEIEAIHNLDTNDWRWHYLHIGLNFGLRSNEIRSLVFSDFDLDNHILNVRAPTTKSKRYRYIPITPAVEPIIKTRILLQSNLHTYYIEARRGTKVSDRSSQRWVKEEEQLGFKLLSHNLRYTFATQLWKATRNIILIQKYLGHTSPEITWRYLKLKREDLDREFLGINFKVM